MKHCFSMKLLFSSKFQLTAAILIMWWQHPFVSQYLVRVLLIIINKSIGKFYTCNVLAETLTGMYVSHTVHIGGKTTQVGASFLKIINELTSFTPSSEHALSTIPDEPTDMITWPFFRASHLQWGKWRLLYPDKLYRAPINYMHRKTQ